MAAAGLLAGLTSSRLERAAQLVGQRPEALGAARRPRVRRSRAVRRASCASSTALRLRRMRRPAASTSSTIDLDVGADRETLFARRLPWPRPVSLIGMRPGAPRREEHEHAELLVALDLAGEARARRRSPVPAAPSRRPAPNPRATSATPMRFFSRSMLRISNAAVIPTATDATSRPTAPSARTWRRAPALRRPAPVRRTRRTRRRA